MNYKRWLMRFGSGSNALIVSDEIYRELYYTPERPASISEFYPRTIIASGLSKSMRMTGWRIGWLAGDAEVMKATLVLHGYVVTCASSISQKAALAAWTDEAAASRAEMRSIFLGRRDFLLQKLRDELGWEPRYGFERGIAETVDWYLANQDWVRRVLDGSYRLERIGTAA